MQDDAVTRQARIDVPQDPFQDSRSAALRAPGEAGAACPSAGTPARARERRADAAVHALGAVLVVPAALWLLARVAAQDDVRALAAAISYCIGAVATFALSAAYNLARDPRLRARLRPWDHAAIFLMIAGTYTPLALVGLRGGWEAWGTGLLIFVWSAALAGMALKIAAPGRWDRAAVVAYLALGWSALPLAEVLIETLQTRALVLLVSGGVLYSGGVAFHLAQRLRYHNAAWHACVLAGAACHYGAVWEVLAVSA